MVLPYTAPPISEFSDYIQILIFVRHNSDIWCSGELSLPSAASPLFVPVPDSANDPQLLGAGMPAAQCGA
ncbi:hypothetical protein chiPu_0006270 [Chiloscyllium punctatum]|uniref:Uncharacterized protein n=1 Tax=Chiloscyllium punctatum TaxID=137246 RepID=A0A401SBV8_CHIPU|nr:hypothetical protein [Chiloscyllium punctatum]